MNKEFIKYIEERISDPSNKESDFDEMMLSLYNRGMVDVQMLDGEPFFSITDKGFEASMMDASIRVSESIEA